MNNPPPPLRQLAPFSIFHSAVARVILAGGILCAMSNPLPAQETLSNTAKWVWVGEAASNQSVALRKVFELDGEVKTAQVAATADNSCRVFINGKLATNSNDWGQLATADVAKLLKKGTNVIAVLAKNDDGAAGSLAYLRVNMADGQQLEVATDGSWSGSRNTSGKWRDLAFDASGWEKARELGTIGQAGLPWSGQIGVDALAEAFGNNNTGEDLPHVAENAQVPEGFKIEKIYQVPRSMGSWVALTTDPQGRLIASDQGAAGLFMITPGHGDTPTKVERLPVELSGAQGLLWAFDALYVVVNGGDKSGLHRLTDTDGDGLVDHDEHCMFVPGGGEHGPHAVILSPDGQSLYVAAGNHTKLPDAIVGSRIPQNWQEDLLLPRRWDANGHAAGILAPGGWICNVDRTGKEWTVFSMGYRNQYDIAFNADGELFSYDADMEWDFGSPWYRPTRVVHATSGSEFGWRSGTGKWPTYYEDSLPAAVDIGPGSPTGIVFGMGAKFPAKYQRALFILDWTYSTIYSIDFEPTGASYLGTKQDFVTGSPLPVTDATIGHDGAFYFAAGGRGTQSSLYRITYQGSESTAAVDLTDAAGSELRELRQQLEGYHGTVDGDLAAILKQLGHSDRFIRYAARIALESQPLSSWRDAVLKLTEPQVVLNGMLALARQGELTDLEPIVKKLLELPRADMDVQQRLTGLRVLQVAFARRSDPGADGNGQTKPALAAALRERLLKLMENAYPNSEYELNAELVQLLVYLESPVVVEKTLALMEQLGDEPIPDWSYLVSRNEGYGGTVGKMLDNMPPARAIHLSAALRNVKTPWTIGQREQYFKFFIGAAKHPGGNSYAKFLQQFRDDALLTCSDAEKIVLEPLTSQSLIAAPIESTPPEGPGRVWTTSAALAEVGDKLSARNFNAGRNLFHATSCAKCHRLAGEGGAIGPDLSTAGKKFSMPDMLDALIEPSKAISDQYGSQQVLTSDGTVLIGRVVEIGKQTYVYTSDPDAKPIVLEKEDIEQIQPSTVSQMPVGLIDTLNPEELRDLMAYIMSAGDPRASVFRKR